VTICAKGISSGALAEELVDAGYEDVRHVHDGMRGWSAVYDAVDVDTDGSPEIVQLQRRAKGCLGYLVADPETGAAATVDPTRHVETVREAAADGSPTHSGPPTTSASASPSAIPASRTTPSPGTRYSRWATSRSRRCSRRDTPREW
jgi:hypothetical protein